MSKTDPTQHNTGSILIVDDTPTNLDVLVDYFHDLGFDVLVATDGHGALEQMSHAKPDVILLESGSDTSEPAFEALNEGDVVGDAYAGLRPTRSRRVGGTSGLWNTPADLQQRGIGAKYVPLDPVDFEQRPHVELSGWPFGHREIERYYARAETLCGLAPVGATSGPGKTPRSDATFARFGRQDTGARFSRLVPGAYRVAPRGALIDPLVSRLLQAPNVRLCTRSTVLKLDSGSSGRAITRAQVSSLGGPTWYVRARRFVLCAGAVENARLLLLSADAREARWGNSRWIGRCFMEHPRDSALALVDCARDRYRDLAFYDLHADGAAVVVGRLGLAAEVVRDGEVPNASVTLLPRCRPWVRFGRSIVGSFGASWPPAGHGWSRASSPALAYDGFRLLLNLEQRPHPENRITLGERCDALGCPVAELHWRWRELDQALLDRLRRVVTEEFASMGLGRIEVTSSAPPDPNAHHHAGTTRMHDDARFGVVDATGRVHGTDNLFVAGASVFPTAGFANPVLTIVALAVRLAEHLRAR